MIFRRRQRPAEQSAAAEPAATPEPTPAEAEPAEPTPTEVEPAEADDQAEPSDQDEEVRPRRAKLDGPSSNGASSEGGSSEGGAAEPTDQTGNPEPEVEVDLAALDELDWRRDGPWDVAEIDLAESDDQPQIDLGAMIVPGFPGAELRLQVAEETQQITSAMLISGDSALELGAYAAPRSGGLWAELREDIAVATTEAGGSASLAEGPFGVELRRLLPVTTPDGQEGYQPSRMWVVEGPRWMLRGIVYGEAALTEDEEPPVADLLAAFREVVVRRGDQAMAPGDLLPLRLPDDAVRVD